MVFLVGLFKGTGKLGCNGGQRPFNIGLCTIRLFVDIILNAIRSYWPILNSKIECIVHI